MSHETPSELEDLWEYVDETIESMGRPERLFEVNPGDTALLVVDMQDGFCSPTGCLENPMTREIVDNINALAEVCRENGIPVIWIKLVVREDLSNAGLWPRFQPSSPHDSERGEPPTEFSEEGQETDLWKELKVNAEKDYTVEKCRYSPFIAGASDLERLLRTMGRDTVIITGVGSNVCCESAARNAMMLDYKVLFVSDANATFHPTFHEMTLMNIKLMFGDVVKTEDIIRGIS